MSLKDKILDVIINNEYFKNIVFYEIEGLEIPDFEDYIDLNELAKITDAIIVSADEKVVLSADSKVFVPAPTN
jgi:hypothetical protein